MFSQLLILFILHPMFCLPYETKLSSFLTTPTNQQYTILSQSQYHFIHQGSYFSYSLDGWSHDITNSYITSRTPSIHIVTTNYQITIFSTNSYYNFIILQNNDPNNLTSYQNFNCYARAANEGVTQMMKNCNLGIPYTAQDGTCNNAINNAANNNFANTNIFLNCSDLTFNYQLNIWNDNTLYNGTLLFILDNSGLITDGANSTGSIELILAFNLLGDINQQSWAKLYLFCGLTGILIVIGVLMTVVMNWKICKIDRQINELQNQKEE